MKELGQAFINTLAVAIPSSIIPLVICSFFAYALTWMNFFGRDTLLALNYCFTCCSVANVINSIIKHL